MLGLVIFGVAVLVVLVTSVLKNVNWGVKTKNLVAAVLSIVGAAVSVFVGHGGNFNDTGDLFKLALEVYGASQLLYTFILKGTAAESTLADVNVLPGD